MAAPLVVPLTPGITVSGDYIIRVTALDAATGNLVTGVNVSAGAILATDVAGSPTSELVSGPYLYVQEGEGT